MVAPDPTIAALQSPALMPGGSGPSILFESAAPGESLFSIRQIDPNVNALDICVISALA
jgi:hypothetical protein